MQRKSLQKDLFEALRDSVGAMYISDLRYPPYREKAIQKALIYDVKAYPLAVWNDLVRYLLGMGPFGTACEVRQALQRRK